MRNVWRVGLALVWLLSPGRQAVQAYSNDAHLQLLSALEQSVVAVGAPFELRVEAYASPSSDSLADEIERQVRALRFADSLTQIELIRSTLNREEVRLDDEGAPVLKLTYRFVLRALQDGALTMPALTMRWRGREYRTLSHPLTAYTVSRSFYDAGKSVFPVVAEHDTRSLPFTRIGSAFLIAPDAVVTSFHVVMDAARVYLILPNGRRVVVRKAWAIDPARDVAVLYVNPELTEKLGLAPLALAPVRGAVDYERRPDPESEVVFTYGWPGGVQRSTAGVFYPSVNIERHQALWISGNPVRPGDSGGPLLDRKGRVLGVVASGTVAYPNADVLHEEVSIASDPRPAVGQKPLRKRPRSLRSLLRDPAVANQPQAHALRLSAQVQIGLHRHPALADELATLDNDIARSPGDANLYFVRGVLYQMLGTPDQAVAAYQAALNAFQGHFPAAYMLALHTLRRDDHTEAERLFTLIARYEPYTHLAAFGLAQSYMGLHRYEEALMHLQKVIRYNPDFAPAAFYMARCYLALGDEARARQLVAKLVGLHSPWASMLRQALRYPALRPPALRTLPRASLSAEPPAPAL